MTRPLLLLLCLLAALSVSAQQLPADGPLTIDAPLQHLAQRLLQNKQGAICAIEPQTGRVLALASVSRGDDTTPRAIATEYHPASTFKVPQALTMLSEGHLTTEQTYPCSKGFYHKNIHIGCHAHRAPTAVVQAIGQSCNSFFCKAFQEFIDNRTLYATPHRAINRWAQYMHSYGLGQQLGLDLDGEATGTVPDSAFLNRMHRGWNGTTIMWMGMGQGEVMVTPLQLCNLAAMMANRGWWIAPHVHEATAERPLPDQYTQRHKALATPAAIQTVLQGMRAAITGGTAVALSKAPYKICGKTGTAENEAADHSIFMGFAPMDNPTIAVSVYIENGGFGADFAAPIAALLLEQYINGHLSADSEQKARRWADKATHGKPKLVEINFDDL